MYFKDSKPLDRAAERRLIILSKRRNRNARQQLVQHNLRLVLTLVTPIHRRFGGDIEDYIQEACIGLDRCIDKFDLSRNLRFGTYAVHWIKAYAGRWGKRLPRYASLDMSPSEHEDGSDGDTYKDLIEDTAPLADVEIEAIERERLIANTVKLLPPIEQYVAVTRLMQDDIKLEEVGRDLGVSRERVRQIEMVAREKLGRLLQYKTDFAGTEVRMGRKRSRKRDTTPTPA